LFAFQFNGPDFGRNFVTLPRSLSAVLPRSMTIEAWLWLPPAAERASQRVLPIVSRFNPRLQTGPANLDSYNDFGFEVNGTSGALRFWMGGQSRTQPYGIDVSSRVAVPTGEWTFVSVSVYSSQSGNPFFASLFINGQQVATQNWASGATRVFQSNEAIALGYRQSGAETFYFEGVLDDVRFWGVPRTSAEIIAQHIVPLDGDEENLVAYYPLDGFGDGRLVSDAGLRGFNGYTLKPLWTLGSPGTLERFETGVSGFPVDINLFAVDLVPTAPDGFEYTLDCLPEHGCIAAPGDPKMECATEVDLGTRIFEGSTVHYIGDDDYLGPDRFCYRARRIGETTFSGPTIVNINVVPAPDTGCLTRVDKCGVCGGDGTSCEEGGCDGKGGQFDECNVCGGDNSTCQCAVYKSYKLEEMDCILFEHAVNRTMARIEHSVETLVQTLDALATYDPIDHASSLDLLLQIKHMCGIRQCVDTYTAELAVFDDYISDYLESALLCEPDPEPVLLGYYERQRLQRNEALASHLAM